MNCFVCDGEGRQVTALALCRGCNIGLCREHLVEEWSTPGPGGFKYRHREGEPANDPAS